MYFVQIGIFLLAVLCSSAEEITTANTTHNAVTTPYSSIQPEELTSKFDNGTGASTEKKKPSRKARVTGSTKPTQQNTTIGSTKTGSIHYETADLYEDVAPHLYDPPIPHIIPQRVKAFTGTYTRNPKNPARAAISNHTPPFYNEQYDSYKRIFQQNHHTQPQPQAYPQNYNSLPPPPMPQNWPGSQHHWQVPQDQQQQNYNWPPPNLQQDPQQSFYYGSQQGPYPGPPPPPPPQPPPPPPLPGPPQSPPGPSLQGPSPQGSPPPFMSEGQQPPPLMSVNPFDQQSGFNNEQIQVDTHFDQEVQRSSISPLRRRYHHQDHAAEGNDNQMNHTRHGYRRMYYPRRWGQRHGQYQQGGPSWQPQYPPGAAYYPQMPYPPPQPPPPPPLSPYHQQMYPPHPPSQMPPQNWPQPQYYQQQPNSNGQRNYQVPPPYPNWQTNVNGYPNQNQQQHIKDTQFNHPPQNPKVNPQRKSKNTRQSTPPAPPPPPPPPHIPPSPQLNPSHQ